MPQTTSIRKAVLLGSREGPWTSIHDFKTPRLRVQGEPGLEVALFRPGSSVSLLFGIGESVIDPGDFVKVVVDSGNPESAICDVLSGAA